MEEYFAKYDLLELVCCGAQGSRVTKGNTFLNTCIGKCCTIVMSADKIIINALKVTTCNSLLAIFAGLLSDLLVRGLSLGPLAPFLAAIVSFQIRFLERKWLILNITDHFFRLLKLLTFFSLVWQPAFSQSALVGPRTTAVKRAPWWKNIGKHIRLRNLGDNHSCFGEGVSSIFASPTILRLGIVQALVEVRPL